MSWNRTPAAPSGNLSNSVTRVRSPPIAFAIQSSAGSRRPRTLPAGEPRAAVADARVLSLGDFRDEGVSVGDLGRPDDLGVREPVAPVGDVLPDRGMEQERLLRDDAKESTVGRLPE